MHVGGRGGVSARTGLWLSAKFLHGSGKSCAYGVRANGFEN